MKSRGTRSLHLLLEIWTGLYWPKIQITKFDNIEWVAFRNYFHFVDYNCFSSTGVRSKSQSYHKHNLNSLQLIICLFRHSTQTQTNRRKKVLPSGLGQSTTKSVFTPNFSHFGSILVNFETLPTTCPFAGVKWKYALFSLPCKSLPSCLS